MAEKRVIQLAREFEAMADVVIAASDWHDEHCGCDGEACAIGNALTRLDAVRAEKQGGLKT